MRSETIQMHPSWKKVLEPEFQQDYMLKLKDFLKKEIAQGKIIYPKGPDYFHALNSTPFEKVRVVILGQDPYHGPDQAHGLSFSVKPGVPIPPSLVNIFKELKSDLGVPPSHHGYLQFWAEQGVLLLNTVLTVEQGQAASHQNKGWEHFTDRIIQLLNEKREGLVFLLWGAHAQKKGRNIDREKHLVIETAHPSPLSAHRGFFGSRPFSKINEYLKSRGEPPIHWQLPQNLNA
jgi:uracil-DNA glycosylase